MKHILRNQSDPPGSVIHLVISFVSSRGHVYVKLVYTDEFIKANGTGRMDQYTKII